MRKVVVKNLVIGEGKPKICLPITQTTREDIRNEAVHIRKSKLADLVEWRADYCEELFDEEGKIDEAAVLEILKSLNEALGKIPLIFTFRTAREGGKRSIHELYYESLLEMAASSRYADIIDLEALQNETMSARLIRAIHSHGIHVVGSSHDFSHTPSRDDIIKSLRKMQEMRCDMVKMACMPESLDDVITLLVATYEMNRNYARVPVITMSMGSSGCVSRLIGELSGSSVTFGCFKESSAPGQIDAFKLQAVLQIIHDAMNPQPENL